MNSHQASILIFLAVIACLALVNALLLGRLGAHHTPGEFPTASILVPARNEARSIEACVRGLLAQDYPDYEVIVLDDESEDATRTILESLACQAPRLRILIGEPPPQGWLGKHWACHQLAQAACGQLLLFTDADTHCDPSTLSSAVTALRARRLDLLSAIPLQETRTLAEKLLVLPLLWSMMSFFPLPLTRLLHLPGLVVACGQCLLFERRTYESIGGHAAVRDRVLDDVALARLVVSKGMRYELVDGSRHVCCRMYHSFREAWIGLTKNLYAVFRNNPLITLFIWAWLLVVHLEPLLVVLAQALGLDLGPLHPGAALVSVGLAFGTWAGVYARLGVSGFWGLLYPASVVLYAALALSSMWAHIRGKARWKGRPAHV